MAKEYRIEEIEAAHLAPDDGHVPHVPFGFEHANWVAFKSKVQPGDRIVDFASAPEWWQNLAGREGYVLMRGEEVVEVFVTRTD